MEAEKEEEDESREGRAFSRERRGRCTSGHIRKWIQVWSWWQEVWESRTAQWGIQPRLNWSRELSPGSAALLRSMWCDILVSLTLLYDFMAHLLFAPVSNFQLQQAPKSPCVLPALQPAAVRRSQRPAAATVQIFLSPKSELKRLKLICSKRMFLLLDLTDC